VVTLDFFGRFFAQKLFYFSIANKLDQMFAYYDAHKIDLQDLRDLNNAGMSRGRPRPRASAE
jgi:hypothetical protein